MNTKRIISTALTLALVCNVGLTAFATESTANQVLSKDTGMTQGVTEMTLEVVKSEDILIATVPLTLPFVVDTRGNVTAPTDAAIVNETDDMTLCVTAVAIDTESAGMRLSTDSVADFVAIREADEEYTTEHYTDVKWWAIDMFETYGWKSSWSEDLEPTYIADILGDEHALTIEAGASLPLNLNAAFAEPVYLGNEGTAATVIGTIAFTLAIVE